MKKICTLLLTILLLLSATSALAAEAKPGETVTVSIRVGANAAMFWNCSVSYDNSVLEFVSGQAELDSAQFNSGAMSFIGSGSDATVGTLTFRVKSTAAAGKTSVSASGTGGTYSGTVSVPFSGATITIVNAACTHVWDAGKETTKPGCETQGVKTFTCTLCQETKTEPIKAAGHTPAADATTVQPTCTADGYTTGKCAVCGKELEKEILPATGHKADGGVVTREATCTETGEKTISCTVCKEVMGTEEVPAKEHTPAADAETVAPTCTQDGYTTGKCVDCGKELNKEVLPATGHTEDEGTVTKEATCTETGEKKITCTVCKEVVRLENVATQGHTEDEGTVTQEPTCTENGKKEFFCTVCEERVREEVLIATGHQAGEWVVTKPVTKEEDGLEEKYCLLCNELLDSKVIPNVTWYYMTVCSAGLRFRDISDLTENWDMFTPIDLSQDGVQTFDLAAGNLHVIGTVTVTVADGAVTVDYDMLKDINLRSEFMTLFSDFASVTTLDESQLTAYPFGEQISIANDLGGDTKVLLYIHNSVNYPSDISGLELLPHKTSAFKAYVEELKLNMD